VRAGEFREDLFYRVSVLRLRIPPLRERPLDVIPLALRFLKLASQTCLGPEVVPPELASDALDALQRHPWPGNVRELENAIYRALVVCPADRISAHHLGLASSTWGRDKADDEQPLEYAEGKRRAIESFQRELVQRALERTQGNVSHAAEKCGLTRAALQRILRQLEIDPGAFK
jgi:two-component system response regulator PilR (NtrC family)